MRLSVCMCSARECVPYLQHNVSIFRPRHQTFVMQELCFLSWRNLNKHHSFHSSTGFVRPAFQRQLRLDAICPPVRSWLHHRIREGDVAECCSEAYLRGRVSARSQSWLKMRCNSLNQSDKAETCSRQIRHYILSLRNACACRMVITRGGCVWRRATLLTFKESQMNDWRLHLEMRNLCVWESQSRPFPVLMVDSERKQFSVILERW